MSTHSFDRIESVRDAGTQQHFEVKGRRYWTRMIVCHGGGTTHTLILQAETEAALDFAPLQSTEAQLRKATTEELDSLANAIRAERQSREPAPDARPDRCSRCGNVTVLFGLPGEGEPLLCLGCQTAPEAKMHPRDCPGVTVTEDDGEVPF